MIVQLKGARTRSLRNLGVEQVPTTPSSPVTGMAAPQISPATKVEREPRPSLSLLIQFDFDSARVSPVSRQALNNLAIALQSVDLKASKFAIEGHTDAQGRAEYNQQLSQQRADAVRELLASQGVAKERLNSIGKGATELADPAAPLASANRRVRVVNQD